MSLISVGWNRKLGPGVGSYSIPVGTTCPGKSDWCALHCYAAKGHFTFPQNRNKYADNLRAQQEDGWVQRIVAEIRASNVPDFRIHVSGDFIDEATVKKWMRVVEALPRVNFWAYTRSWRLGSTMLDALNELRSLPNMSLYASWDDSIADETPEGWVVARTGDIVQLTGTLCPNQTSGGKVTCANCRLCIEGEKDVVFVPH